MKRDTRTRGSGARTLVVLGWFFLLVGGCAVLTGATVLVLGLVGIGLGCLVTAVVLAVEDLARRTPR
ncbi:hypothetical protein [Nonomuraea sp. NPDC048826]|uniref:hypothetical protein n=1 Tax=Nonomuraea sp. NPDC048826 TaxID=3364347 RepID=UPI003712691A